MVCLRLATLAVLGGALALHLGGQYDDNDDDSNGNYYGNGGPDPERGTIGRWGYRGVINGLMLRDSHPREETDSGGRCCVLTRHRDFLGRETLSRRFVACLVPVERVTICTLGVVTAGSTLAQVTVHWADNLAHKSKPHTVFLHCARNGDIVWLCTGERDHPTVGTRFDCRKTGGGVESLDACLALFVTHIIDVITRIRA